MAELEDSEAQNLGFQGAEEALTYNDDKIFDTVIINDSVDVAQDKLKDLQSHGIDPHGMFSYFIFKFFVEKTPSFLEFIS